MLYPLSFSILYTLDYVAVETQAYIYVISLLVALHINIM